MDVLAALQPPLRGKLFAAAYLAGISQRTLARWFHITNGVVNQQIQDRLSEQIRRPLEAQRRRQSRNQETWTAEYGWQALSALTLPQIHHLPLAELALHIQTRMALAQRNHQQEEAEEQTAIRAETAAQSHMRERAEERVRSTPSPPVALPSAADVLPKWTPEQRAEFERREAERVAALAKWKEEQAKKEAPPEKPKHAKRRHYADSFERDMVERFRQDPESEEARAWFTLHPEDKP